LKAGRWQIALGFLVLIAAIFVAGYAVLVAFRKLASLDQPVLVAILAASATVLTSTLTVVVGRIFERKKEIEAHFRQTKFDQYDELLQILFQLFDPERTGGDGPPPDVIRRLRDWQRKLILFAGPKTIVAFVDWMRDMKMGRPTVRSFVLMDHFFKALRADLGISNRGLEVAIFAHLILRHGDLLVAMAKKNQSLSIDELAELEKLIEVDAGLNEAVQSSSRPD